MDSMRNSVLITLTASCFVVVFNKGRNMQTRLLARFKYYGSAGSKHPVLTSKSMWACISWSCCRIRHLSSGTHGTSPSSITGERCYAVRRGGPSRACMHSRPGM
ncbi:hypothetical protein BD309DRAFT_964223 [Dichomitus squalens]|uniref:Uncharacterized protein n=1 Tax=Dichomitus squalens TaxID=114155 RepID=A0A4Q9PIN9_9APHY|nr:hypothetical protein BD309DRAFT_964223 [Dichomitus squalens]TBU53930.1 hypothetical protein BD310DRAFT_111394 [Dichomitus squalens]